MTDLRIFSLVITLLTLITISLGNVWISPTNVRGAGTRDKPLRTSACEATYPWILLGVVETLLQSVFSASFQTISIRYLFSFKIVVHFNYYLGTFCGS